MVPLPTGTAIMQDADLDLGLEEVSSWLCIALRLCAMSHFSILSCYAVQTWYFTLTKLIPESVQPDRKITYTYGIIPPKSI